MWAGAKTSRLHNIETSKCRINTNSTSVWCVIATYPNNYHLFRWKRKHISYKVQIHPHKKKVYHFYVDSNLHWNTKFFLLLMFQDGPHHLRFFWSDGPHHMRFKHIYSYAYKLVNLKIVVVERSICCWKIHPREHGYKCNEITLTSLVTCMHNTFLWNEIICNSQSPHVYSHI